MQHKKLLFDANLNRFFYIENGQKTTEQVACFTIKFRFFLFNVSHLDFLLRLLTTLGITRREQAKKGENAMRKAFM